MKKEIKKKNKMTVPQGSHELRAGNFIIDTAKTVKENLTRLCQTSVRQRNVVLNQIQKMISTGELQGYQHQHRPNEFYISAPNQKHTKTLCEIPWELTLLKIMTLSNNQNDLFKSWNHGYIKNNSFLIRLKNLQLSNLEVTILADNLISFLLGKGSVYLSDIGLPPKDYLLAYLSLRKGELAAMEQGFFRCVVESDNVTIRIDSTQKAIELLAGVAQDTVLKIKSHLPESIHKIEPKEIEPVDLMLDSKSQAIFNVLERAIIKNQPNKGISALLNGPSGCGKTEFVMQLARQTDVPIYQLNMASIRSKWIGDTEKIASEAFRAYLNACKEKKQIGVLLMNEADGLLGKRILVERGNDLHANQIQNTFLQLLEEFNGVLIATTNFPQNIDSAFKRRFLFWHKMEKPSEKQTNEFLIDAIKKKGLPRELVTIIPSHGLTLAQMNKAIQQYNELKDYCSLEQISQLICLDFNENNQKRIGFAV
jgi:hypothetical protein